MSIGHAASLYFTINAILMLMREKSQEKWRQTQFFPAALSLKHSTPQPQHILHIKQPTRLARQETRGAQRTHGERGAAGRFV